MFKLPKNLSFLVVLFVRTPCFAADEQWNLTEDWLVRMGEVSTSQDYIQGLFLGGLTALDSSFVIAGGGARVDKRSLLSGESIQRFELAANSQTTWVEADGSIYGGDTKGFIYQIDLQKNEIAWKQQAKGILFSRPLVQKNQMWMMNSYGSLESYAADSGQWLWQQRDPKETSLGMWSYQGPQFFNGYVVNGFPSGVLMAFEPSTGKRVWSEDFRTTEEDTLGLNDLKSLQASGEYLVASSFSGDVKAWKKTAGSQAPLWEKRFSLHTPASFDVAANRVYVSDRNSSVMAIELSTGYVIWKYELTGGLGSTPAYQANYLWVVSSNGVCSVLNRETGALVAKSKAMGSAELSPALVFNEGRSAVVLTNLGILRRYSLIRTK